MRNINHILHRISILYYVFLALYIVSIVYSVTLSVVNSMDSGREYDIDHASGLMFVLLVVCLVALIVATVWTIVLFVKLLITIGKSIKRKNIFNLRTVNLINRNAILNGVLLVLICITEILFKSDIDRQSLSLFEDMMGGALQLVMMLIFGQVLKIGYILKQELTI